MAPPVELAVSARDQPFFHSADLLALPRRHSDTLSHVVSVDLFLDLLVVMSDAGGCRHALIRPGFIAEICRHDSLSSLTAAQHWRLAYAGTATYRQHCSSAVARYSIKPAAHAVQQVWAIQVKR